MKKRVLIADNSEEFCDQLVQSLKKHDVLELIGIANDGEQAIRMVKQLKPDMLVIDLLLAKRDCIGVLKEIYSMEKRPVVVATSRFISDYVSSAVENLGVHYLMLKPCDSDSLTELIEDYWSSNQLQKIPQTRAVAKIATMATDILHEIGIPAHIKGYHYLREAIIIAVEDPDVINALTKCCIHRLPEHFTPHPPEWRVPSSTPLRSLGTGATKMY